MEGRSLAHYQIRSRRKSGAMGDVYEAHDQKLDRDVALKVSPEEVAGRPPELLGANGGGHISLTPNREWISENDHTSIQKGATRSLQRPRTELFYFDDSAQLDDTVWAPSGRWIAFDKSTARGGDLYKIDGLARAMP